MRTLTLRIYLTVLAVLTVFALLAGWAFQTHLDNERARLSTLMDERLSALGSLLQFALPAFDTAPETQVEQVLLWSDRLAMPLALDDREGRRMVTSPSFVRRYLRTPEEAYKVWLDDGRALWLMRPALRVGVAPDDKGPGGLYFGPFEGDAASDSPTGSIAHSFVSQKAMSAWGVVLLLLGLLLASALAAWPAVRALTARLQHLKAGLALFGQGNLAHRVPVEGQDEVASVAASFNAAADQIQALLQAHKILLANASHELRSPLARLRMAVNLLPQPCNAVEQRALQEILTNVGELDALVEEVLLSSRLDAGTDHARLEDLIDWRDLAQEEAERTGAQILPIQPKGVVLQGLGDEKLLRRALRNLLENARRYGGGQAHVQLSLLPPGARTLGREEGDAQSGLPQFVEHLDQERVRVAVCDHGPGVPVEARSHIFEAFYRLPGHAEQAGGVGLGLALVKQIAERHGGTVHCEGCKGGGASFVLTLPSLSGRLETGAEAP